MTRKSKKNKFNRNHKIHTYFVWHHLMGRALEFGQMHWHCSQNWVMHRFDFNQSIHMSIWRFVFRHMSNVLKTDHFDSGKGLTFLYDSNGFCPSKTVGEEESHQIISWKLIENKPELSFISGHFGFFFFEIQCRNFYEIQKVRHFHLIEFGLCHAHTHTHSQARTRIDTIASNALSFAKTA